MKMKLQQLKNTKDKMSNKETSKKELSSNLLEEQLFDHVRNIIYAYILSRGDVKISNPMKLLFLDLSGDCSNINLKTIERKLIKLDIILYKSPGKKVNLKDLPCVKGANHTYTLFVYKLASTVSLSTFKQYYLHACNNVSRFYRLPEDIQRYIIDLIISMNKPYDYDFMYKNMMIPYRNYRRLVTTPKRSLLSR
jgi:hypothetical protein